MKPSILRNITIVALILISQLANAQYALKLADIQYNLFNYHQAADLYTKAYQKQPTLYSAERLASCYHQMRDYKNEESWYAITLTLSNGKPGDILAYAKALQTNSKYSEAKVQYLKYGQVESHTDRQKLNLWIASCDSAVKWMQNPVKTMVTNQRNLNSKSADWGAVSYQNEIIFASDRTDKKSDANESSRPLLKFKGNRVPDKIRYDWTGNGYLKLYQAGQSGKDTTLKKFPIGVNTNYHTGPLSFSQDGRRVYYTITRIPEKLTKDRSGTKTVRIEIYSSELDSQTGAWLPPVAFKYNNINNWSVGDPFLTADGSRLYFVSDKPGGKGGTDIYYCLNDNNGGWLAPINLAALNTPGNERTPVIDTSGNFYYSTDGGITMGGLDIYKATLNSNDTFTNIHNMAYPVNSSQDDFSLFITANGAGYLSSNRIGGLGSDDIYRFEQPKPIAIKLEGIVYDKISHEKLSKSIVSLKNDSAGTLIVETDQTGYYKFNLAEKSDYNLTGEKTNYRSDSKSLTTRGITDSTTIKQDLYLEKVTINKAIKLENINYDFDKANIREDAKIELNKLIKILKDNPTIWIELSSHTDSRGSDIYNMKLSQRRAESAVKYITVIGGISPARITAKGYGETQLLNQCTNGVQCNEAEHQVNRRTEFKIVKQ